MKKLFGIIVLFLFIIPIVLSIIEIKGFVNDYANILKEDDKTLIESILKEIYDSKKAEYAVVIIDSLNGSDIESYSINLAQGHLGDSTKNNGLLLLVAINDRRYRFETGRGLEVDLPDIILGRIGRTYLSPNFKNKDYGKGIIEASNAISSILLNNTDISVEDTAQSTSNISLNQKIIVLIIIVVVVLIIISIITAKKNISHKSNDDYFTAAWVLSQMFKGGRGGGGGFGGGGFGGGSFGGGGAGSGW